MLTDSLKHSIGPRTYYLVPGTSDTLWVVLHGGMGNAKTIEHATAPWGDAWVAYPEGTPGTDPQKLTWNAGTCCGAAVAKKAKDVEFISTLILKVCEDHPEIEHVNIAGFSNGAMLVYQLMAMFPDGMDGIGVAVAVSGTCCSNEPWAAASATVPFLHIHGAKDSNVPYMGGQGDGPSGTVYRSVPDSLALVREPRGKMIQKVEAKPAYKRTTWSGAGGKLVQLKLIYGGTHQWPADGTVEAMQFAKKFGA